MLDLCEAMLNFYPMEIAKIAERIAYIQTTKQSWQNRQDI